MAQDAIARLKEGLGVGGGQLGRLKRGMTPLTAGDALTTGPTGRELGVPLGYIDTLAEGSDLVRSYQAAQASLEGTASPEQTLQLMRLAEFGVRPKTFGYKVVSTLRSSLVAMQELFTGAGVVTRGGKALGKYAAVKTVQTALEKMAAKNIAGKLVVEGAVGAAAGLVNEALMAPVGGGRAVNENYRRLFESMDPQMTEDDAGNLSMAFSSSGMDFWEALPKSLALALIEPVSERSGGALSTLVGYDRIKSAMAGVAAQWMKQSGKGTSAFLKTMQKAGWNGIVEEMLEERYGDALRVAMGEGDVSDIIPDAEQFAVELVSFGAMGTAINVADRALGGRPGEQPTGASQPEPSGAKPLPAADERSATTQLTESVTEAPVLDTAPSAPLSGAEIPLEAAPESEGPPQPESPTTLPSVEGAATPASRQELEADPGENLGKTLPGAEEVEADRPQPSDSVVRLARAEGRPVGELEEVEPDTPAARVAASRMKNVGLEVRFVRGMRAGGAFVKPGEVILNPDVDDPREYARHEQLHNWVSGKTEGEWLDFYRALRKVDDQGLRTARARHRADWMEQTGKDASAYRAAFPRAALRLEEGFATYAQELYGYLELLETPEGVKHLQRLARGDQTLFQKLIEAIRKMFGGGAEKRFEELQRELGIAITPRQKAAVASMMLKEALDSAEQGAAVQAQDPKFAPPPKGKRAPKRIEDQEIEQLKEDRERALAGEEIGRPDLAITTPEADLEATQKAVDEARNRAGEPGDRNLAVVQKQAITLVKADSAGMTKGILGKVRNGEALTDVETFALRELTHSTAKLALRTRDELAWRQTYLLHWAYRQSGSDQSRAFSARQARFNRKVRGEELMALVLARPTFKTEKRLDKLIAERPDATDARTEEIDREIERLMEKEAKTNDKVYRALQREGYDPATITRFDWEDPASASKLTRIISTNRAGWDDKAREFLYASMLSFPYTHVRNIRGNFINLTLSKHIQETVEAAVNVFVGDPDSPSFSEAKAVMTAVVPGLKEAGRRFFNAYRFEDGAFMAMEQDDVAKLAEGVRGRAIGSSKLGRAAFAPLNWISLRLLRAADEAFKGYIGEVATAQLALRQAKSEGVTGETLERRVRELMLDPDIAAKAKAEEVFLTFQEELDPSSWSGIAETTAKKFRTKLDSIPGLPLLGTLQLPFIRTPLRLVREAIRRSPMQWALYAHSAARGIASRGHWPGGKRAAVKQTADAIIAGFIFWGIMAIIDDEDEFGLPVIGGAPAKDYAQRNLQYRTRGPNTIRLGGVTYNYKNTDPIAGAIATTVDSVRAYKDGGGDEAVKAAIGSIVRNLQDSTYLRTLGDLFSMADGRKDVVDYAASTLVTPWVPNIIKGALRESDENVREARVRRIEDLSKSESVVMRLPFKLLPLQSIAPPPRYDVWGRPLKRTPISLNNGVLLERSLSSGEPVKIDAMVWRWNQKVVRGDAGDDAKTWAPSVPRTYSTKDGARADWSDDDYAYLVRESGQKAAKRLLSMRLNWEDPTEDDIDDVKKAISAARKSVVDELWRRR